MFGFRLKNLRVRNNQSQDIELQEIFLDKLAEKRENELGFSERKFEVPLSRTVIKVVYSFIILLMLVLFSKTFAYQILDNDKYVALSDDNKFISYSVKADRGVVYDINGEQLVFNKASFNLLLNEKELPEDEGEKERIFKEVMEITGGNFENLDHQTLILLETKISGFPGFYIERSSVRDYKDSLQFSHIIGYTGGEDGLGKEGIEKSYEEVLKKNSGEFQVERDVYGNVLSKELISYPDSGESLVLWTDAGLQRKVYEALQETLERTGSKKAVGVALNPKTGGVMAMVSIPGYDNNLFTKGSSQEELQNLLNNSQQPLFNRVISGLYPTGSTIKPLVASAALQEKIISADKKIFDNGFIEIKNKYNPEIVYRYSGIKPHGWVNMKEALAVSSNIYFYTIGGGYESQKGLGPSNIKKYVELFGWGKKTGIDLLGEADGFIPSPAWKAEVKKETWFDGDTYNFSIGQGDVLVTPLQVASAFSAIANGGTLYVPKIVKEVINDNKSVLYEIKPEIIRNNFIDPDYLAIVREGMRLAVTGKNVSDASSVTLNSLPVKVAAKTGTAQTPVSNLFHNWASVFAPYEDPEIVLVIMIENVKDLQAAALPTVKNILQYYFNR
ncbi:hypothetical protein KKA24_01820 [Patescibacteria group bacterium]|nr:hypothetical protein [Patescibacteria group bacterium]